MRRVIAIAACLSVLMFAGASTALARGPHHGGPGRGPGHHHHHGHHGPRFNSFYRAPVVGPYCGVRPRVAAYPVYPVPTYPVVPTFPQLGFGIGGRNFSFWYQQ